MINHVYKEKYLYDSCEKQFVITVIDPTNKEEPFYIYNSDLINKDFKLEESLCSRNQLTYGVCEASRVTFTTSITTSIKNKLVKIEEILDGDVDNVLPYGLFIVTDDDLSTDRRTRKITAYDQMYRMMVENIIEWYNGLIFPMTQKQLRLELFEKMGVIEDDSNTLPFDNLKVRWHDYGNSLTAHEILENLCEFNGVFARFNREGKLIFFNLKKFIDEEGNSEEKKPSDISDIYDADISINKRHYYNNSLEYSDNLTHKIDKLTLKHYDGSILNEHVINQKTDSINTYTITGNPFISEMRSGSYVDMDIVKYSEQLSDILKDHWFASCKFKMIGNPCYEVGDRVKIVTDNAIIYTYIFRRTISGIKYKEDEIDCIADEYYPSSFSGVSEGMYSTGYYGEDSSNKISYLHFSNSSKLTITNKDILKNIIQFHVKTGIQTDLILLASVIFKGKSNSTISKKMNVKFLEQTGVMEFDEVSDVKTRINYKWEPVGGDVIAYEFEPLGTWKSDSDNTMNLLFTVPNVKANTIGTFTVSLIVENDGSIVIQKNNIRATLLVQGAEIDEDDWDGTLDIEELVDFYYPENSSYVFDISDRATVDFENIQNNSIIQTLGDIKLKNYDMKFAQISSSLNFGYIIVRAIRSVERLYEWKYDSTFINTGANKFLLNGEYVFASETKKFPECTIEILDIPTDHFNSVTTFKIEEV